MDGHNSAASREADDRTAAAAAVDDGSSGVTSPLSSAPLGSQSPLRSHVRVACGQLPVAPLTGRAHQRFHEGRRLVCGGCCFRVDVMPADEADKAASAEAAGSGDVDAAAAASGRVQLSVLLVRSKKRDEFIWPKGGWEKFETSAECAARECLEEGGVEGRLLCALTGVDFSSKKGRPSRLQPYLLQATVEHTHWAEEGLRQRQWVRAEDVERTLGRAETVAVWNDVKEQLRRLGYMDEQGRARFIEPPLQNAPKELLSVADIAAADSASSSPSSDDAATTGEAKSPL